MKGGRIVAIVLVLSTLAVHTRAAVAKRSNECDSDEFDCGNSDFKHRCIPDHYVCDGGTPDCADGRDEDPSLCPPPPSNCTASEFYCAPSKTCLHNTRQCDGERDCPDDSDELNCPPGCDFNCTSDYTCLRQDRVCDGTQDCSDGSDESDQLCGPLCSRPSLPNYDLEDPKLFYDVGTVVTLRCAKGYKLAGYDMAKCQENGTWFPRLPNCTLVEVTPDPVKDNTTLLPSAGAAGWPQEVSFGVGLVVGVVVVAMCLLVAVSVMMLSLLYYCRKKYKQSGRFSAPAISYFSDMDSEASVTLPDADELKLDRD